MVYNGPLCGPIWYVTLLVYMYKVIVEFSILLFGCSVVVFQFAFGQLLTG